MKQQPIDVYKQDSVIYDNGLICINKFWVAYETSLVLKSMPRVAAKKWMINNRYFSTDSKTDLHKLLPAEDVQLSENYTILESTCLYHKTRSGKQESRMFLNNGEAVFIDNKVLRSFTTGDEPLLFQDKENKLSRVCLVEDDKVVVVIMPKKVEV